MHLDLIIGLPGESIEGFGRNLDKLAKMSECEIQVGILKKLSGTRINRHDEEHKMVYSNKPPYEIISNALIDQESMDEMKVFARYWDIFNNSGNFTQSVKMIWGEGSVFEKFRNFCRWLYEQSGKSTVFHLDTQAEYLSVRLFDQ